VLVIPRVKENKAFQKFQTLPQIFGHYYGAPVALLAAVISGIGYTGFTSSQILAGAKLASGSFEHLDLNTALWIMGLIAVIYTVMGGLKAVIFTDTIQWILLLSGLIFIGLPMAYHAVGGMQAIQNTVRPELLSLANITWQELFNWGITIIPIWFVGMTLYQRIYATKDVKSAQRAWYIAGLFEWPIMAFLGVSLGLLARIGADQGMFDYLGAENISDTDPETGLPMLLRTILPVGLTGLMLSAYFSAVLSTADSCLMAASGNVVTDLIGSLYSISEKSVLRLSQIMTLVLGLFALFLASLMTQVLDLMLISYAFMVSGLLVPLGAALFFGYTNRTAAFSAMLVGGLTTVILEISVKSLPLGLDANFYGILASLLIFSIIVIINNRNSVKHQSL